MVPKNFPKRFPKGNFIDSEFVTFRFTMVGTRPIEIADEIFSKFTVNSINKVNTRMLGNFKTLTYEVEIAREKAMDIRREIMRAFTDEGYSALYEHGDWTQAFVFWKIRV